MIVLVAYENSIFQNTLTDQRPDDNIFTRIARNLRFSVQETDDRERARDTNLCFLVLFMVKNSKLHRRDQVDFLIISLWKRLFPFCRLSVEKQ